MWITFIHALDVLHLEHDWTVYFGYSIISILLCLVKLFVVLYCCHLANKVVYISNDLEWLSEIVNDTKHHAVCLRLLSYFWCWYSYDVPGLLGLGLGLGLEAFGLGLVQSQGQGQSDQYSSKHSVSRYNYTYSTLVYQRHWYHHSRSYLCP